MPLGTRKHIKEAREAAAASNAAMADRDRAELKSASPSKRARKGVPKTKAARKSNKSHRKANKAQDDTEDEHSDGSGTSPPMEAVKRVTAQFDEGDNRVDFKIEAPPGEFSSDGLVSSSDPGSDSDEEDEEVQLRSSQETRHSASARRSSERWSDSRTRSRSRSRSRAAKSRSRSATPPRDRKRLKKHNHRRSVEQKLDSLTTALAAVQQVLLTQHGQEAKGKDIQLSQPQVGNVVVAGESQTTIYRNAVDPVVIPGGNDGAERAILDLDRLNLDKRVSSSSEEGVVNTSDELLDGPLTDNFIPGQPGDQVRVHESGVPPPLGCVDPQPGTSKMGTNRTHQLAIEGQDLNCSAQMIREADSLRVRQLPTPGESANPNKFNTYLHSAFVDEEYLVMGSHVDKTLVKKIHNHEYVDFARLLPRDRVSLQEDQRMELVNWNRMSYWTPVADCELNTITNFSKWEAAFRVFANIYTAKFPDKASDLLQYYHVTFTASQGYVWDNVYLYDKEFRIHMSKHPRRSWAIILQQAWNLRLQDKVRHDSFMSKPKGKSREACKRFNRGKCHSGLACQFEHRCLECGKFGHGQHICRNRNRNNNSNHNGRMDKNQGENTDRSK